VRGRRQPRRQQRQQAVHDRQGDVDDAGELRGGTIHLHGQRPDAVLGGGGGRGRAERDPDADLRGQYRGGDGDGELHVRGRRQPRRQQRQQAVRDRKSDVDDAGNVRGGTIHVHGQRADAVLGGGGGRGRAERDPDADLRGQHRGGDGDSELHVRG